MLFIYGWGAIFPYLPTSKFFWKQFEKNIGEYKLIVFLSPAKVTKVQLFGLVNDENL